MERPRKARPVRTVMNTMVVLVMGAAMGYSVYPLVHDELDSTSVDTESTAQVTDEPPAPLEGVEPLDAVIWPGRHIVMALQGTRLDTPSRQLLAHVKPGAVVLNSQNLRDREQVKTLVADIKKSVGLGTTATSLPLVAVDLRDADLQPLGLNPAPSVATLASIGNEDTARTLGRKFADDLSALGFSLVFSPILDVFDSDAYASDADAYDHGHFDDSEMALAFLAGAKAGGVIPIAQGFPGRRSSHAVAGSPVPSLDQDRYVLAKVMYSFIDAMSRDDKIPAILVEHVAVPGLDEKYPTRSAALSPVLVQTVLRNKCAYDGVIVAADVSHDPAVASDPTERVAVQALSAGCDAVVMSSTDPKAILAVCKAIETAVFLDTLSGAQLDASKDRLDTLQNLLRALDRPEPDPTTVAAVPLPAPESPELVGMPVPPPTIAISREDAPPEVAEETAPPTAPAVEPATPGEAPAGVAEPAPMPAEGGVGPFEHTVGEQESLTEIANDYGVTVKNLLTWNALIDPQVQPGQVLRVAPPQDQPPAATETAPETPVEPSVEDIAIAAEQTVSEEAAATAEEVETAAPETTAPADEENLTTHTVVAGDTLYRIAVKYNTTPERLSKLNNIKNSNVVVLGSKLKVPAP